MDTCVKPLPIGRNTHTINETRSVGVSYSHAVIIVYHSITVHILVFDISRFNASPSILCRTVSYVVPVLALKLESTYSSGTVTNKDIARTDKNVIYKFIVKEMEEAADEGLLSANELGYKPSRISQSAAWGILARVYLFWAGEHYRDGKPASAETNSYFERASFFGQKVMAEGHDLADDYWDTFIDMCS